MHIVTLSFDDGFLKSNLRIAELYEARGLAACFNVLALGHDDARLVDDPGLSGIPKGGFSFWNELQARGHEIMPHGYRHANLPRLPFEEACSLIAACLDVFTRELRGFEAREAIFNFPYNASSPELEAWLAPRVRAFRTLGDGINPLPHAGQVRLTTTGCGPENCEHDLERLVARLLDRPEGWLVYNLHGLDDEGWGPIGSAWLERLLDRLLDVESVRILPARAALRLAETA